MPTPARPIMVATDLSPRSDRAVDRALQLAGQFGVRAVVVHALEKGSMLEAQPELADATIRSALPDPEADVDIVPALGSAPATIAEAARSAGCGLIVTGVARLNHVGDYVTGTAVDHVVRHADVPVLVVKQRARGPYRSILVASDFSTCSRSALLGAATLFPDAALHLVHAYHVPYESWLKSDGVKEEIAGYAQGELDAFLADPAIPESVRARVTPHLGHGELHNVVTRTAREVGADLVALGTHGRSGFVQAVIGSAAQELLRWVPVDTLMLRAKA
jgi:nucleotide-binding universal stress UspA family protein